MANERVEAKLKAFHTKVVHEALHGKPYSPRSAQPAQAEGAALPEPAPAPEAKPVVKAPLPPVPAPQPKPKPEPIQKKK